MTAAQSREWASHSGIVRARMMEAARGSVGKLGVHLCRMPQRRHHRVISQACEMFVQRRIQRLMIFAPPRHGKSFYGSWFTPASILARRPGVSIIHAGHTQKLVDTFGRRIRNTLMRDDWPWPETRVMDDASAKGDWQTTDGSQYFAVGMDGSAHGRPANVLLLDDPVRSLTDADSPTIREKHWESYKADLCSRLEGDAQQMIMVTRWNEDDIPGSILPEGFDGQSGRYADRETGEEWVVVCLPAVCEHASDLCGREIGDWLWPVDEGGRDLSAMERRGGRTWASLYQQRPAPAEGIVFDASWVQRIGGEGDRKMPPRSEITTLGASDYAVTDDKKAKEKKKDPDYTVHLVGGMFKDEAGMDNLVLLDIWRGRKQTDVWVDEVINLASKWRTLIWAEESGQIIKAVGPYLQRRIRERKKFFARRQFVSSGSKSERASAIIGMFADGRVWIPRGAKWETFIAELLRFPAGKHDDQVDALTLIGRLIDVIYAETPHEEESGPAPGTMDALWKRFEEMEPQEEDY